MRQPMIGSFVVLVLSCTSSCEKGSSSNGGTLETSDTVNRIEQAFDSSMSVLSNRYHYGNLFSPVDSGKFHSTFILRKTVYLPAKNLKIDYRTVSDARHAFVPVFQLYNDSFNFVLPLTDWYFYKYKSKPVNETLKIDDNLSFGKELKILGQKLGIKEKDGYIAILDAIADMLKLDKISSDIEFNLYQAKANVFLTHGLGPDVDQCSDSIRRTISLIKREYLDEDKVIYSDGIIVLILTGIKDKEFKLEILNTICMMY